MALGGGITPAWMLTPNQRKVIVTKQEKLIQVLTDAANVVTPTNGGADNGYIDPTTALVEVSYRIGRALTLARSIARSNG